MMIKKIAVIAGAALLFAGGGWAGAQPQHPIPSAAHGYGAAGAPSQAQPGPRALAAPVAGPGSRAPSPAARPDNRPPSQANPVYHRPESPGAHRPPVRYRQPAVLVTPSILIGSVLPYYGYGYYPIDDWSYYNLPAPCCGQYWVQYGQSFLLVGPDGVVLQVFTP